MELTPEERRRIYEEEKARLDADISAQEVSPGQNDTALPEKKTDAVTEPSPVRDLVLPGILLVLLIGLPSGVLWINHATTQKAIQERDEATQQSLARIAQMDLVTQEEFETIQVGHTYQDLVGYFGRDGVETGRSSLGGVQTVIYQWSNPDGGNMIATFQNGRLISKAQAGLPR